MPIVGTGITDITGMFHMWGKHYLIFFILLSYIPAYFRSIGTLALGFS